MNVWSSLATGLYLTVWGMGLVFLLLVILWGLLTILLRMDRPDAPASAPRRPAPAPAEPPIPAELMAAIGLAVLTHQAVLRKQAAPMMRSYWPGSILFASRWVAAGRHQQAQNWHPHKR
jgi:Na+-transporting methylmalonyl-CoA/oxaloacetate decarboxylase gamma subunit